MAVPVEVVRAGHAPDARRRATLAALWRVVSTVTLVSAFAIFAIAHFKSWQSSGQLTGLGLVAQETLFATLFLFRRAPRRSSTSVVDWILASGGSFLVLALRPSGHTMFGWRDAFVALQFAGLFLTLISLTTLGRSFGIVAADRGLKTGGPYAVVRHPIYASYMITQCGYVLQNLSLMNVAIIVIDTGCQIGRIRAEERMLRRDPTWASYAQRVRFRLLPGVY
jgi:protein-S-isoprenylcysteine O-methyltransferase Ste14